MSINESNLVKKLTSVTNTQDSVQTLSLWIIHHRAHHRKIVDIWTKVLKKSKPVHRLTMLYLANDVLQNGKRKGVQQFIESFSDVLPEHTPLFRDERITKQVDRVFTIWAERSVFSSDFTKSLKEILHESKHSSSHHRSGSKREESSDDGTKLSKEPEKKESGKPKNPEVERIILEFKPEKAIDKIKKIKKVEIETSTKLTNLTSRNMDVSSSEVLRKFKDRTHGQQFQKDFDEATRCLEEYIKALEKEVAERNELIRMLEDAKVYYDSQNGEARIVASAYKNFGNRVKALKKKLEAKTKTLPSPVPSPTPDAPSPTNSDDGLQLPAIQETAEYSTPDAEVEAPLMTDNGAVIDSPCSAPSPGSAPSPEGSPVGLSPVIPGTGGDSGTTSNATGNATALSSFMSQSPTVLSSWLDAFNQEFQENRAAPTAVNTSTLTAAIPAQSTLESRLSNLMQSMGHIPGGLFSSTSSASNTPKRADSPPYSSAVFRSSAAVSEVHSGNTPLKDENSGQGTPVLDENTARKVASLLDSDMRVHAMKPGTPQDSPDTRLSAPFGSRITSLASPQAWMTMSPKASSSSNVAASQSAPALAPPPIPPALQAYLEPIKTVTGAANRSVAAVPKGRSETPPSPSADYLIPVAENFDVTDMELDEDGSPDDEHSEARHRKKLSNLITLVQPQVSPAAETSSPGSSCSGRNVHTRSQLDVPLQPSAVMAALKLASSLASPDDTRHLRNPSPDLEKEDLDFPVQEMSLERRRSETTDFAVKESSKFNLRDSVDIDDRKSTEFRLLESSDYTTRERSEFRVRESSSSSSEFRMRESPSSELKMSEPPSSEFRIRDSSSEFRIRDSPSSSEFQVHDSFSSDFHAAPAKIETVQMRSSLDRSPPLGPMEDRGTWERGDYYSPRVAHHQPQQQQAMSNGGNRMRGRSSGYYGYEMRGRPVDPYREGYGAYESEWHGGRPPSPRYRHYGGQARGAPYFQPRY